MNRTYLFIIASACLFVVIFAFAIQQSRATTSKPLLLKEMPDAVAYRKVEGDTRRGNFFVVLAFRIDRIQHDLGTFYSEKEVFEALGEPDLMTTVGQERIYAYLVSRQKPKDYVVLLTSKGGKIVEFGYNDFSSVNLSNWIAFGTNDTQKTEP